MKFSELKQKAQERISRKAELDKRIAEYERCENEAKERAQVAAENGNVDEYKSASNEAQEYGTQLIVAKAQRKKLGEDAPLTRDEADTAWEDYTSGYNKQFDKLFADYQKKRKDLLNTYRELVDLQCQAFEAREWLADNCGIDTKLQHITDNPFERAFPCKMLPKRNEGGFGLGLKGMPIDSPDATFFVVWYCKEHNINDPIVLINGEGEVGKFKDVLWRGTTRKF